ncbi:virulence protein [Shewanella electrodiphila]|uniref:Virulence protein n=1 Tax=Shewanella electrodiphila TaxID=934143 RepID=A0ABT0KL53_9GAMM|nr:virulence protein [Shewanella electrodiphila]MCL1044321.1 virulence protein [Shewanella electrodiphila]
MLRNSSVILLSIFTLYSQFVVADEAIEVSQKYQRAFPIWAQEAMDLGHELPKPYGFTVNYMSMEQPLVVDGVTFSGLGNIIDDRVSINGSEAMQDSETITLRADMWVLPFLNLYGVIGQTKGSSVANVQVEVEMPWPLPPVVSDPFDFELNFKGTTYGAGGTIVGGIGNWFALLDVNYTNTDLDILDGEISSIVVSPRVGYRTTVYGHESQFWVGAMYQNVEQTFSGYLKDIGIPLGNGKFEVTQHLEDKWNSLIGGQINLGKGFDLLLEGGFGTRTSFMAGIGYRF